MKEFEELLCIVSTEETNKNLADYNLEHKVNEYQSFTKCALKNIKKNPSELSYYIFFKSMEKCLEIESFDWFFCANYALLFLRDKIGDYEENWCILTDSLYYCYGGYVDEMDRIQQISWKADDYELEAVILYLKDIALYDYPGEEDEKDRICNTPAVQFEQDDDESDQKDKGESVEWTSPHPDKIVLPEESSYPKEPDIPMPKSHKFIFCDKCKEIGNLCKKCSLGYDSHDEDWSQWLNYEANMQEIDPDFKLNIPDYEEVPSYEEEEIKKAEELDRIEAEGEDKGLAKIDSELMIKAGEIADKRRRLGIYDGGQIDIYNRLKRKEEKEAEERKRNDLARQNKLANEKTKAQKRAKEEALSLRIKELYVNFDEANLEDKVEIAQDFLDIIHKEKYQSIYTNKVIKKLKEVQDKLDSIESNKRKVSTLNKLISSVDTNYTFEQLKEDKDSHITMFEKVRGSIYKFTTDKVYPFLNNTILESIIPEKAVAKTLQKIIYKDSTCVEKKLLNEFQVDYNKYSNYFRFKDNKLIVVIPMRIEDIIHISTNFLNNERVVSQILKEYNCDLCDFHTDHATNYSTHLKTKTCMKAHGLIEKEVKVTYCDTCEKECNTPSALKTHRRSNKCMIKRGVMTPKKEEEFNCNLCKPNKNMKWSKGAYKAHLKTKKCRRLHSEAGIEQPKP